MCKKEIRNLDHPYKTDKVEYQPLKQIDLTINHGESLVIVGTSIKDKSTILNRITGIDTPIKGSIIIDGRKSDKMKEDIS